MRQVAGAVLGLAVLAAGAPTGPGQASAPSSPLYPLHVTDGRILGPNDQTPWFRGVNVNALVQYNRHHPEAVPVHREDFAEMHALGFNLVRLPLSLSRLEPRPGVLDRTYLQDIRRVLADASREHIWVILDLHQDRFARMLFPGEADGFPAWAVRSMGLPTRPLIADTTDAAVQGAFTEFWLNRPVAGHGLQFYYLEALTALAEKFGRNPAVAGFDVMNEPNPGLFPPIAFAREILLPFYRRAVTAIRAVDGTTPIFLEPDVVSAMIGFHAWPTVTWWAREGVVFEPHFYTGTFRGLGLSHLIRTLGAEVETPMIRVNFDPWNGTVASLAVPYRAAAGLSRREGVPWLIGEFGNSPTASGNAWLQDEIRLQNRYGVGGLLWLWKIRPGSYPWGLVQPNGALTADPQRAAIMASPHPLTIGGTPLRSRFHFRTGRYVLRYDGDVSAGATDLFVSSLTYPTGFSVRVSPPNAVYTIHSYGFVAGSTRLTGSTVRIDAQPGPVTVTVSPSGPGSPLASARRSASWSDAIAAGTAG